MCDLLVLLVASNGQFSMFEVRKNIFDPCRSISLFQFGISRKDMLKAAYVTIIKDYNKLNDLLTYKPSLLLQMIKNESIIKSSENKSKVHNFTWSESSTERDFLVLVKERIDISNIEMGTWTLQFDSQLVRTRTQQNHQMPKCSPLNFLILCA